MKPMERNRRSHRSRSPSPSQQEPASVAHPPTVDTAGGLPAEYRFAGTQVYIRRDPETGDLLGEEDAIMILESMKMEIPVLAEIGGIVTDIRVASGDVVQEGDGLVVLQP